MLEHEIDIPEGWQTAWLLRTSQMQHCYTTVALYALSLAIILLGLMGYFSVRSSTKELAANPTDRSVIFNKMNKKALKVTKGHFWVAIVYMLHVIVFTGIDAIICAIQLGKDAASDPEAWTTQLMVEMALYSVYLMVLFAASFILVPLVQMILVTYGLARFSRRHGSNALADYIPEACFLSTHVAQIWCMVSFFLVAWWAPSNDSSIWRYVVLQACFGSALAWLEASFTFNFRAGNLQDKELNAANGGVRELLYMFHKTVKAAHSKSTGADGLPSYEEVPQDGSKFQSQEEKEYR